jgi:L-lactate dehydrogenase (cytochrome)
MTAMDTAGLAAHSSPTDHARPRHRARQNARLEALLNLDDFQRTAQSRLPRAIHSYVANGAEDEVSLRTNGAAFDAYRLVPRVLVGVTQRDSEIGLFGRRYTAPFGIAPMGGSAVVAYDADVAMARAAAQHGIPFVLSGNSITPMEEVAANCPGAWFAASVAGQAGVTRAIDLLAAEVDRDMALLGLRRLDEIDRDFVRHVSHAEP